MLRFLRRRARPVARGVVPFPTLALEQLEERSLLNAGGLFGPGGSGEAMASRLLVQSLPGDDGPAALAFNGRPSTVTALGNGLFGVGLPSGVPLAEGLFAFGRLADVVSVQPDFSLRASALANDPRFSSLYGLDNTGQTGGVADADIDAPEAWDSHTGGRNHTVVGVIDTGIDYRHPDLYLNIWLNEREIPSAVRAALTDVDNDGHITFRDLNNPLNIGDGKARDLDGDGRITGADLLGSPIWSDSADTDGNGYRDDFVGWDFANNDNNPIDDNNHGTHVAGTIGAIGNNGVGVVGVNWRVNLMALKFLGASGSGAVSGAIAALNYSVANGAHLTNNSWGGGGSSPGLSDAINAARLADRIFVAAAGNESNNNDAIPSYPANYNFANVVSVGASDASDRPASFSNYGATTVDLFAPGVGILSTTPNGTYSSFSGTSMATPHVAGALALLRDYRPELTSSQLVGRLLSTVDPVAALAGKAATGGRLNLGRLLANPPANDTSGPKATAANFVKPTDFSLTGVRVTFSEAVDAATFTTADVTLTNPAGVAVAATTVTLMPGSDREFLVTFAEQTAAGTYRLGVGPDIRDRAGNAMDQDGDGTLGEAADDIFTATASVAARPTTLTYTKNTSTVLRDRATTTSSLNVPAGATIADLNLRLNIDHTYDSDLIISLRSPDGTSVRLVNRRGGSGDNFRSTVLDDEATTSIVNAAAPFTGTYRPEAPLSTFDGKALGGTWVLWIEDVADRDVGTLLSWSLVVTAR